MTILPEQTDIADGDKRLNLHRLAGRGPGGEPKGGGPAGEMVGIFLTVAEWQIPTILGSPTEGNPTEERGRPTATPANAMDCSRGMRLLLRRLLLDELLNGLLSLNGRGAGAHPALLD